MLLMSLCAPVITWLCNRAMRFQSRPKNWPLITIESPVAQWLEHPNRSWRVVGSNPIRGSVFFLRILLAFNIMQKKLVRAITLKIRTTITLTTTKNIKKKKNYKQVMTMCAVDNNLKIWSLKKMNIQQQEIIRGNSGHH